MTKFVVIGGFLGSGKTTAILRLAQMHMAAGRRVGVIANDLAGGLVDSLTYRAHGLPVEEMNGVCFACRFDDLIAAAGRLQDGCRPDVLLAEPAGSCTDIVSRVIEPLRELYAGRFEVAPYVTLLDPHRARQALSAGGPAGFAAKVTFLYKMQQSEADIVAVNKADLLDAGQQREVRDLVSRNFPNARIVLISALTGQGFPELASLLDGNRAPHNVPSSLDPSAPQIIADAERSLSWFGGEWELTAAHAFDADAFLLAALSTAQARLRDAGHEPGHVKALLRSADSVAICNVVSSVQPPSLSRRMAASVRRAHLTLNARVEIEAGSLHEIIERSLAEAARRDDIAMTCISAAATAAESSGSACLIGK